MSVSVAVEHVGIAVAIDIAPCRAGVLRMVELILRVAG